MARQTEKNFSKSIGAGLGALAGGSGRTFCILQHKNTTSRHRAGENQEIIVDYIELGRDPQCGVRFGDDCQTVSRRHAAISKVEGNWVIRHLSTNNPTLINGRPVAKEWFLQNGDEIQLSMEGPRIGFMVPQNSSVKSIGLSRRLSLFRQQSLRPYRNALAILSIILVLTVSGLSYLWYVEHQKGLELQAGLKNSHVLQESLAKQLSESNASNGKIQQELQKELKKLQTLQRSVSQTGGGNMSVAPGTFDPYFTSIYFIYCDGVKVEYQGETETVSDYKWSGTGFLLNDGRFITARHVVEPWAFLVGEPSELDLTLNVILNQGGKITANIHLYSPNGSEMSVTNHSFTFDKSGDTKKSITTESGKELIISSADIQDGRDWAFCRVNGAGNLFGDASLSDALPQGSKLDILGYPLGLGANTTNIKPLHSATNVAQTGLNNGVILVTSQTFDQGSSGGPALYLDPATNKYMVIGIVSAKAGGAVGIITPISSIR